MRASWLVAAVAILLTTTSSTPAGVYQTGELLKEAAVSKDGTEPLSFKIVEPTVTKAGLEPIPHRIFRSDVILSLPAIEADRLPNNKARAAYLEKRDELFRKQRTGRATEDDLVNLSACLIRLGEANQAENVLMEHTGRDCRNFMLLANRAAANYLADPNDRSRLSRAIGLLQQAFDIWPRTEWKGLTAEQVQWYRRAETFFRDFLRVRLQDLNKPQEDRGMELDPLLGPRDDPVRFVGESGAYEAGKLAAREREKLPKDAVAVVQQLLVWLPTDTRLYWLYGELLNAEGDVNTARGVFEDCVNLRRYNAKALLQHRQIVNQAAEEAALAATKISWLPESGHLYIVGAIAAVLVLALLYFQAREFRRRAGKG
jgi:hypothetical protein